MCINPIGPRVRVEVEKDLAWGHLDLRPAVWAVKVGNLDPGSLQIAPDVGSLSLLAVCDLHTHMEPPSTVLLLHVVLDALNGVEDV